MGKIKDFFLPPPYVYTPPPEPPPISDEDLFQSILAKEDVPLYRLSQWVTAVTRIVVDLQGRGVELEVPAQTHVPYLDN